MTDVNRYPDLRVLCEVLKEVFAAGDASGRSATTSRRYVSTIFVLVELVNRFKQQQQKQQQPTTNNQRAMVTPPQ